MLNISGIFGVVSKGNCFSNLLYGTDYHSHLGTKNAGLAVFNGKSIQGEIHDISLHQFKSQFVGYKKKLKGKMGIGVISDYEPQPLIIGSHLGTYAIVHVGMVKNLEKLVKEAYKRKITHFTEMSGSTVNPTELIATLINQGKDFVDGIKIMQNKVEGSSSIMLLTKEGIYLARDKLGRTPIVVSKKKNAVAATLETCAFPTLGLRAKKDFYYLGPGEIGIMVRGGYEQLKKPGNKMQICSFLWIYYGFPASIYEGINVETARYRCGAVHAEKDMGKGINIDFVAGIPDSGTSHALGYAEKSGKAYKRPYIKYTPT